MILQSIWMPSVPEPDRDLLLRFIPFTDAFSIFCPEIQTNAKEVSVWSVSAKARGKQRFFG